MGTLRFEPLTRLCGEVILEILIFGFGRTCMALKAGFPLELARREIKAKPRFVYVLCTNRAQNFVHKSRYGLENVFFSDNSCRRTRPRPIPLGYVCTHGGWVQGKKPPTGDAHVQRSTCTHFSASASVSLLCMAVYCIFVRIGSCVKFRSPAASGGGAYSTACIIKEKPLNFSPFGSQNLKHLCIIKEPPLKLGDTRALARRGRTQLRCQRGARRARRRPARRPPPRLRAAQASSPSS